MNVLKRLWAVARNRKRFRPRSKVRAGRLAELEAARVLDDQLAGTDREVWASRRIPDHVTGRRREFDFLVAAPSALLSIELKNWSGRIEQDDGRIIQHRRRGGTVDHGPLWATLDDRLRTLQSFLEGHDIQPPRIRSLLVFMNPNLAIPEDVGDDNHELVHFAQLDTGLPFDPSSSDFLAGAMVRLLNRELDGRDATDDATNEKDAPAEWLAATRSVLDHVGTWDRVRLYGGRTVAGDIETVVDDDHPLDDRDRWERGEADVTRSYLAALREDPSITVGAHEPAGEQVTFEEIALEDELTVRAAGDREPTEVPLRHLEAFVYGYPTDVLQTMDWEALETGKRYMGRVTGIVEFGLFADIGGPTDGLVHISNVDPGGHTDAYELPRRFDEGDVVDVRLTDIDRDAGELDLVLVHHRKT